MCEYLCSTFYLTLSINIILHAVVCPSLTLDNGVISYSDLTLSVGSVAMHTCNHGYSLSGDATRNCTTKAFSGVWSGSKLTCQCVFNSLSSYSFISSFHPPSGLWLSHHSQWISWNTHPWHNSRRNSDVHLLHWV